MDGGNLKNRVCYREAVEKAGLVRLVKFAAGEKGKIEMSENRLLFIIEGKLRYDMCFVRNKMLGYGFAINLPEGSSFEFYTETDVKFVMLKIMPPFEFCPCFSFDKLLSNNSRSKGLDFHLAIKKEIWEYLNPLILRVEDGISCDYFWEIKIKELLFLLKQCYTEDELQSLFCHFRTHDLPFAENVKKSYKNYDSITELAESMNFSLKGFEKRFKKVFGLTPRQWITKQRLEEIRHELVYGTKNLKTIAHEQGFVGTPQLNDFCKKHFKKTPGKIRQQGI